MSRRTVILIAIWTIAFVVALRVDYPIASWVHGSGLARHVEGKWWAQIIKEPGEFRFTIVVAAILVLAKRIQPKQAVFILLAGVVSGVNFLIKWIVGRTRPYKLPGGAGLRPFEFHPFWHGISGLFSEHDLCFPSGHECTAAALAAAIFFVWPRGAWVFVLLAVCVGIERPAENAHYTSDVIAAVGVAMLGTGLLYRALARWMEPKLQRGFEVIPNVSKQTSA